MARKKSSPANDSTGATGETPDAPRKSKARLLLTVALCLGLAGGGYVLGGRKAAAEPQASEEAATTADEPGGHGEGAEPEGEPEGESEGESCEPAEPPEMGAIVDLPALSVNLADGHYLRVAVSVALSPEVELETPEEFKSAPAKDLVVATLSGRSMDELSSSAGREQVKSELTDQIVEAYHGEIESVFFTEFVMQ